MSNSKIKLSKNWKRLEKSFTKNPQILNKHLKKATMLIGKYGEAVIRKELTNGSFEQNAPLTIALKGGRNEPLKGDRTGAPLFKAITSSVIDDRTVFVGVLQTDEQYNIAIAIHEGITIGVTEKMRNLFYVLWLKEKDPSIKLEGRAQELWNKMSSGWKPLKSSTTAIKIPARKFISQAWETGEMQKIAKMFWEKAISSAIKELVK